MTYKITSPHSVPYSFGGLTLRPGENTVEGEVPPAVLQGMRDGGMRVERVAAPEPLPPAAPPEPPADPAAVVPPTSTDPAEPATTGDEGGEEADGEQGDTDGGDKPEG